MGTNCFNRAAVTLDNWRSRPYSTWSFQNVSEIVPSAIIRGTQKSEPAKVPFSRFLGMNVTGLDGTQKPLLSFFDEASVDAMVVMRDGEIIGEWYADHCAWEKPHLIFSISKSMTGLLAGTMIEQGLISLETKLEKIIPEAKGSAFAEATFAQLLDMQVSLDFEEYYLDPEGPFNTYRRAMLWSPDQADNPAPDLKTFLCSIPKAKREHGMTHAYRSPNADFAGIILERITGMRLSELFQVLIWQPMGAYSDAQLTLDRAGNARASGGFSMTARDLARVGYMVCKGGDGILPRNWVDMIWAGGDKALWAQGDQAAYMPGGSYKNFWYHPSENVVAGVGLLGQLLWVDRKSGTVIAKLCSEPTPDNLELGIANIEVMKKICAQ